MIGGSHCHISKTNKEITLKRSRQVFCLVCYQVSKFERSFKSSIYFKGELDFTLNLMMLTHTRFFKLMVKNRNVRIV